MDDNIRQRKNGHKKAVECVYFSITHMCLSSSLSLLLSSINLFVCVFIYIYDRCMRICIKYTSAGTFVCICKLPSHLLNIVTEVLAEALKFAQKNWFLETKDTTISRETHFVFKHQAWVCQYRSFLIAVYGCAHMWKWNRKYLGCAKTTKDGIGVCSGFCCKKVSKCRLSSTILWYHPCIHAYTRTKMLKRGEVKIAFIIAQKEIM